MKVAFLYAGQGSQKVGMGKDLYETFETYRKVIDSISLPFDFKQMMHEGELEQISKTENTQCLMAAFAAGVTAVLAEHGLKPDCALGLSLGEYGALHAAGVIDAAQYVQITRYRGCVMAEAAKGHHCSMSAVLGMEASAVEEACEACKEYGYITLANYNCPGQYVICGDEEAVVATENYLKEKGAKRCIRLNVSGPFHTKYMKPAGDKLGEFFRDYTFEKPQIPVLLNVTGDFYDGESDLKENLVKQVQSSVHFEESVQKLLQNGVNTFVEIGPGNALTGFVKKTAKAMGVEVKTYTIDTAVDLQAVLDAGEEIYG